MEYRYLYLENFKGVKEKAIPLDGKSVLIQGTNGSGKSTILDAITWLFTDKNYALASNPNVAPIGDLFCDTTVSLKVGMGEVEIDLKKVQERKEKGDGYATTNKFYIDDIPKKKSEFYESLAEFGIVIDRFLAVTHPEYFFKQTDDSKRSILTGMIGNISDKDIALKLGYKALADKLDTHTLSDIKKVADDSRKAIEKLTGKSNCIINGKLDVLKKLKNKIPEKAIPYVDEMIATVEAERTDFVKRLSDEERTMYEIKMVIDARIKEATSEINSHFNGIEFQLWDEDKSGNVKPCCIPIIDGFKCGDSANSARELLAKVEIMKGISKYYSDNFPMLIDNAECLDKSSMKLLKADSQIIVAMVSNKKLEIK